MLYVRLAPPKCEARLPALSFNDLGEHPGAKALPAAPLLSMLGFEKPGSISARLTKGTGNATPPNVSCQNNLAPAQVTNA